MAGKQWRKGFFLRYGLFAAAVFLAVAGYLAELLPPNVREFALIAVLVLSAAIIYGFARKAEAKDRAEGESSTGPLDETTQEVYRHRVRGLRNAAFLRYFCSSMDGSRPEAHRY